MNFSTWFETFLDEKGLDGERMITIEGSNGTNIIPLQVLFDEILAAPKHEQKTIKQMIVNIDFHNGDVVNYFKHLAQVIAI